MLLSPSRIMVAGAAALLMLSAVHYPLATSFPIGGDAASYITKSQQLLAARSPTAVIAQLLQSRYPVSEGIFTASVVVPVSWPERFTWMMTFSYSAAGVTLGWLAWRLTKKPLTVAAVLFFWSVSIVGIQPHIEDATFAQLFSLIWLALACERIVARSLRGSTLCLLLAAASHPYSGLLALITVVLIGILAIARRQHLDATDRRFVARLSLVALIIIAGIGALVFFRPVLLRVIRPDEFSLNVGDLVRSPFGIVLLLVPAGLASLWQRSQHELPRITIAALLLATLLLAFNDRLGIGLSTNRFHTYFNWLAVLLGAVAVPVVLRRAVPPRLLRTAFAGAIVSAMVVWTIQGNTAVYRFYESPSRNARLHPNELTAFTALQDIVPSGSKLMSGEATRHVEWIPILSGHPWQAHASHEPIWQQDASEWQTFARTHAYTHLVIVTMAEEAPVAIAAHPDQFPVIFENNAVTVYAL